MSREDHPAGRSENGKALMVMSPLLGVSPLLTCGHYGPLSGEDRSKLAITDSSFQCPICGQTRQMDIELQHLIAIDGNILCFVLDE
jgi:hypothetical protein